jgi:hypothetical protein
VTIESVINRVILTGNGVTVDIPFPYAVHAETDLVVIETIIATGVQTIKALTTHYTFSGTPDGAGLFPDGGTITALVAPASTVTWTVYRDPPAIQQLDLVENDGAPAEAQEAQFDYLTMLIQRIKGQVARSLRQPEGDSAVIDFLPSKVDRSSMYLGFDTDGDPVALAAPTGTTGVSAFMATVLDDANAAAARATLGITVTSNKDDEFLVTGSADTTKKLAFEVDTNVATATTRTVTIQNLNGTMALTPTVASYTGTATLGAGVGFARLSGASFTLTLPPIATASNRPVTIQHQGTSLTQVYTIKGNVADNIIAADGTANTYLLYTNGEEITLIPDGTSWYVTQHRAETDWVDDGAIVINATTTGPTKPTTPDMDKCYWRRSGNRVFARYVFQVSSAAGSAAGTGNYLVSWPASLAIDTTVISPVLQTVSAALRSEGAKSSIPGTGIIQVDSTSNSYAQFYAYDSSRFQVWRSGSAEAAWGSASGDLTTAELSFYFEIHARAANWRV